MRHNDLFVLAALLPGTTGTASARDSGDRVDHRLGRRGDRLDHRWDHRH